MASSFLVGDQNVNAASISFLFSTAGSDPLTCTAYIFSDSGSPPGAGGQPVSFVASAQLSFATANLPYPPQFYTFSFSSEVPLEAGTKYWAAIGIPTPGGAIYIGETRDLVDFTENGISPILSIANGSYPANWNPVWDWRWRNPVAAVCDRRRR